MKQDHLAPLLLSLTPAEKKYFIQFASLRSDDKSYMKLYDCVLRDGAFNADKLSKELKKTKANLAHEKEYLIENVMKALRNFHDKLPEVGLYNKLEEVAILNEKGLFELSKSRNSKAMELAQNQSRFHISFITTRNEDLHARETLTQHQYIKQRQALVSKLEKNSEQLKTSNDLFKLYAAVDTAYRQHPVNLTGKQALYTRKFLKHRLLTTVFEEPMFTYMQLRMLSKIYQMLREKEKTFECGKQKVELIEKHPHQLQIDTNTYFQTLHGYLLDFLFRQPQKDLEGFDKIYKGLKKRYAKLPFDQHLLDNKFAVHAYIYYLPIYGRMVWWQTIPLVTVNKLIDNFEKDEPRIKKYMSYATWFNCAVRIADICFMMQDYGRAVYWYQKLLNEKEGPHLEHIALFKVKMGFVLAHAQLGNFTLVPHLLESARRFLRKTGHWQQVEKITAALLHRLPNLLNNNDRKDAFEKYLAELRAIKAGNSIHKRSIAFLLYQEWALLNLSRKV